MKKRPFSTLTQPPCEISIKDMNDRLCFWTEFFPFFEDFKFSPYGTTTLDVPAFHKKNVGNAITTASVDDYQYSPIKGRQDLRRSVLTNFPEIKRFQKAGFDLTIDNILISSGAVSGIAACIDRFCEEGDEVILLEPVYPLHMSKIIGKKLTLRTARMNYNQKTARFEIDYDGLKNILSSRSKIMVLCNPNNPACNVYTAEEYQKISEIIRDFPNLTVIEDAAYFLYYRDDHQPIPYAIVNPTDFDRTITFYSAGKMYNVTGLRIGIGVGPKDKLTQVSEVYLAETQMIGALEQLVVREDMISANIKNENDLDFYEETRKDVVQRGKMIMEEMKSCGINTAQDDGTYYILLDVEALRGKIDEKYYYKMDNPRERTEELDKAFCRMLFLDKKVGFFPMSQLYFGKDIPDNLVRVAKNRKNEDLEFMLKTCKDLLNK